MRSTGSTAHDSSPRAKVTDGRRSSRSMRLLDPAVAGGRPLADLARLLAGERDAGAVARQARLDPRHGRGGARDLRAVLEPALPLLVNDRVDVALAAEADGVHLGQDDMTARRCAAAARPQRDHRLERQDRGAGARPRRSSSSTMSRSAAFTPPRRRTTPRPPIGIAGLRDDRRRGPRARARIFRSAPSPASTRPTPPR